MTLSLRTIDRWLFEEYGYDWRSLAIFRIAFASYLLLVCFPAGLWIHEVPATAFSPPIGLAAWLSDFPPHWLIISANAFAFLCVASLLVGLFTPITSVLTAFAFVLVRTSCYADGKIDHDILNAVVPLALAFSGWGNDLSFDALRSRPVFGAPKAPRSWLLAILALLIGLALLSAGLAKLRGGWLRFDSQATIWYLLPNYLVVGREQPLTVWAITRLPRAVWELMDWTTTIWECSVCVLVLRRRWFVTACAIGCLFHFGVWQLFEITFTANVLAYAVFVPWSRVLRGLGGPWSKTTKWLGLAFAGAVAVGAYSLFRAGETINDTVPLHLDKVVLSLGLCGALAYFAGAARSAVRARRGLSS